MVPLPHLGRITNSTEWTPTKHRTILRSPVPHIWIRFSPTTADMKQEPNNITQYQWKTATPPTVAPKEEKVPQHNTLIIHKQLGKQSMQWWHLDPTYLTLWSKLHNTWSTQLAQSSFRRFKKRQIFQSCHACVPLGTHSTVKFFDDAG